MSLFEELKRRNVFRVGIAYLVGAWVLAQVAELLLTNFEAPTVVMKSILVVLIVGFPLAVFLAWAYELTPEGVKPEAEVDRTQSTTRQTGRKLDRLIITFLVVALGYFAWDKFAEKAEKGSEPFSQISPAVSEETSKEKGSDPFSTTPALPAENSIAVLPFVNMSSDPEQEYFSDGITEEILNRLAGVHGLQVAARTSAFSFKGHNQDVREIARTLGVGNILEGSVRKADDQVRITAQLIRASDGFHLWSESYDRKLENIFAIQDDIASQIARALEISLGVSSQESAPPRKIVSPEVYDLYLRARALHRQRGKGLLEAIDLFQQALAIDPDFAPAWAGLSHSYVVLPNYVSTDVWQPLGDLLEKSMMAAQRALELDPNLPTALHAMGNCLLYRFEWAEAEDYYKRALELDPDSADIMEDYAGLLLWSWQLDPDQRVVDRMVALEPRVTVFLAQKVSLEHAQGKFEQRDKTIRELLEISPELGYVQFWNLFRLLQTRDHDAAYDYAAQMDAAGANTGSMVQLLDWMADVNEPPNRAVMEALVQDNPCPVLMVGRYDVCIDASQQLQAIWPQWGMETSSMNLLAPVASPELMHQFRADPRTKAYLKKLHLPEYWRKVGWPGMCQPIGEDDFECH